MKEYIKAGSLVEYKFSKNGKWHNGRIDRVQPTPDSKLVYSVEVYGDYQRLNWEEIVKGIERGKDRHFIAMGDEPSFITEEGWHFIRWFSKDYVRVKSAENK